MRVGHHRNAAFRGLVHDPRQLLFSVRLLAWVGVRQPGAFGATRLDDVDPVVQVHANHRAQRGFGRDAILERPEPCIPQHGFAKVRRDEHTGRNDIGTRDSALLHQVAERNILVVVRARAAHRRDARLESAPRIGERRDVRVGVDESRNDVTTAHVDDRGAGRRIEWLALDLGDLSIPDHQRGVGRDRAPRAIDQVGVAQHDRWGGRLLRRTRRGERTKREDDPGDSFHVDVTDFQRERKLSPPRACRNDHHTFPGRCRLRYRPHLMPDS
jgi:hypothetical protein